MKLHLTSDIHNLIHRILIACFLIALSGCQSVPKQPVAIYFDGLISERSQYASVGALVRLQGEEVLTNENGCFLFEALIPSDTMTFEVEKEGYKPMSKTVVFGNYRAIGMLMELSSEHESPVRIEPITRDEAAREPCIVDKCFNEQGVRVVCAAPMETSVLLN